MRHLVSDIKTIKTLMTHAQTVRPNRAEKKYINTNLTVEAKKVERAIVSTNLKMSTNSSDTDDDFGQIPTDYSDESDEATSEGVNSNLECEFLTKSDLICEMKTTIAKVAAVLHVSEGIAKALLNQFEWNAEQLIIKYYDAISLNMLKIDNLKSDISDSSAQQPATECEICLTPFEDVAVVDFQCGHRFCEGCCGEYFKAKVLNDGVGNNIKCPHTHCEMVIDDATVIRLIPANILHVLHTLMTRAFVEANPLLRYCQSEACEYTMKANTLEPIRARVICKCGSESCLQCGEIWHDAINCALLKKWKRICVDDLENAEWLYENTQKCPKCTFNIEKDGGCNHMQCRSCGYHFCWMCRSEWHQHKTCNKFVPDGDDITARLIHYSTRYENHVESLKLERGIYDSVVKKMPFLTVEEVAEATSTDMIVLKQAVQSLQRSRQILISTYVFAYYSISCNQLTIFEDNQSDLERATENLSWLLERGISSERWVEVKHKLEASYDYCNKRRGVLLEHIKEGYQNDYWKMNDD